MYGRGFWEHFLSAVLIESGIFFSILKRKKQDMEE